MELMERMRQNSIIAKQLCAEDKIPQTDYSTHDVKKYKLMLKQHWELGFNYLCITKTKEFVKYKGSGKLWKSLLKKHPSRILTKLLFSSDDLQEFAEMCKFYSDLFDVVNNKDFANLIPELGYEGNQGNLPLWVKNAPQEVLDEIYVRRTANMVATVLAKGEGFMVEARRELEAYHEKHGVTSAMHIPEVVEKCKVAALEGNRKKYGVDNVMRIQEFVDKSRIGFLDALLVKYGTEMSSPSQIPGVGAKIAVSRNKTLQIKYGVSNPSQIPGVAKARGPKISKTLNAKPLVKCQFCDHTSKKILSHELFCDNNPNRKHNELIECIYCHTKTTKGNITKSHNEKCKQHPNYNKEKWRPWENQSTITERPNFILTYSKADEIFDMYNRISKYNSTQKQTTLKIKELLSPSYNWLEDNAIANIVKKIINDNFNPYESKSWNDFKNNFDFEQLQKICESKSSSQFKE
jgi:hypothetical protein